MKEGEKERMRGLNDQLAGFISRVQELKAKNATLAADNEKYLKQLNAPSIDVDAIYRGEREVGKFGSNGNWMEPL